VLDIIQSIHDHNADRDLERVAIKYAHLRKDAFSFLRGTCHLFYERLPRERVFRDAPLAWICGDLHLENFGSYKGDNRLVYFDLNDFDEALLAPCTLDIVRFITSLMVGVHEQAGDATQTLGQTLGQYFLDAYAAALAGGKARWIERDTAMGMVRELLDGLRHRRRADFLDTRTEKRRKIRHIRLDGRKALPSTEEQRVQIGTFMAHFAEAQPNPDFFKVLDIARRIAGIGSLGLDRYIILVEGKGSPDGNYLLDLKQSIASSLVGDLAPKQPVWHHEAERIVDIQRHAQAIPMAFLNAVTLGKNAYVLRSLQPSEDRVSVSFKHRITPELEQLVQDMGALVAWGHLRSSGRLGAATVDDFIAFGEKKKWQQKLMAQAEGCCEQVLEDWATFSQAYDNGAFSVSG